MAKVAFTKLNAKTKNDIVEVPINNNIIEVKQYLPINEKLKLISNVINQSMDDSSTFINPVKVDVFTHLEMIYNYTNISFTDKQKEDVQKLYDSLYSSGYMELIFTSIPQVEYDIVYNGVWNSIESYYEYHQSALGIMDSLSTDYKNTNFDAEAIRQTLANKEGMEFLDKVLEKLG